MSEQDFSKLIEYAVVGGYLLILIGVGLVFRRLNRNVNDYFRNGCRGKWWLVGMSAFMTTFSAWTFVGAAGMAYMSGWSVIIMFGANIAAFLINAAFLAPWFRQLRATTAPEIIKKRFGTGTQQFYSWITVVFQLIMSSVHLLSLSVIISAIFGFPTHYVIGIIGAVVLFYSLFGGSWGIMANDFIQSLILLPMTVLVAVLCLYKIGGVGEMFNMIQEQGLTADYQFINEPLEKFAFYYTWAWSIAIFIKNMMVFNSMTQAPRYFSVKDGKEARKAALLASALYIGGCVFWFIPPITARLLFNDQVLAFDGILPKYEEASYAIASLNLLPLGMTGLMAVAMFAATTSSMDSGLNRNAAVFTKDIYPTFCSWFGFNPVEDKLLLRVGQGFTLAMGLSIISIAYYFFFAGGRGVFQLMLDIGAMLGVPMTTPLLMGLFLKRSPSWAAIVSVCAAGVTSFLGFIAGPKETDTLYTIINSLPAWLDWLHLQEKWLLEYKIFVNIGVGVVAYLSTMPFWFTASDAYRKQADDFFKTMRTPIDFDKEVGDANDGQQGKIVGSICMFIGGCISALILIPGNTWGIDGRLGILFVGGVVAAVGTLLYFSGRKHDAKQLIKKAAEAEQAEEVAAK
ncbi:hypothetical protein JD969_19220 [Planctomycetota bacterium]|nr:hypothetical protein JD969_19220 [Planctomycetota bacterium]